MSRSAPIDGLPRAPRINDLGPTHTPASPETGQFRPVPSLRPTPPGFASATPASTLLRTRAPMR